MRLQFLYWLVLSLTLRVIAADAQFRVLPYLQNPASDAITVVWLSEQDTPGTLTLFAGAETTPVTEETSAPESASALAYPIWEVQKFFDGSPPSVPFIHRMRLSSLLPRQTYRYQVRQGTAVFEGIFTTAPPPGSGPVRLVFFADCETEPESTGKRVKWPDPADPDPADPDNVRRYLLDQTAGLANNLRVILERDPDLIAIAGDLVEAGGEQRDWDEFWRHFTDVDGINLAGRVPLLAAPGNHEYYEGPSLGKYDQPGSERAVARFLTYFAVPDNGSDDPSARGRYYRLDYGPVTLIALDVTNGSPDGSTGDTNFMLLGRGDEGGGASPGFGPGTEQYAWLERQLADARRRSAFTFVFFHHVPYSVGSHGWPTGTTSSDAGRGEDNQSGVPVRSLTPLFLRYGVDALMAGHDEMWERSQIEGVEVLADGTERRHTLHVFDVGIGGDGLRGPKQGLENPYQRFLAHTDAPEVWADGILRSGGKHYGHLEVDVLETRNGGWQAVLKPVYVFPLLDSSGRLQAIERRLYDDVITLTVEPRATVVNGGEEVATGSSGFQRPFPNPFNSSVLLRFSLATEATVRLDVFDAAGRRVRRLLSEARPAGHHAVEWDATDTAGVAVASGVYFLKLEAGTLLDTVEVALIR